MKILLLLIFVFFSFAGVATAQLCGTYTTTLEIKSEDSKAIENAVVQILAVEKDETRNKAFSRDERDRSKFSINFNEGYEVSGKYKIFVSADGFEAVEKEIKFPHCKDQTFEIKLKAGERLKTGILTGTVFDPNGAVIPGTKITAVNQKGEKFETLTNEDGEYVLKLPFNEYAPTYKFKVAKYEITVLKDNGFAATVVKDFKFVSGFTSQMRLDFALDVAVIIDTIPVSRKKSKN